MEIYTALDFVTKDPDEVIDYTVNWAIRLGTDTISTSNWEVGEGGTALLIDQDSKTTNTTTVWLDGGTHGITYVLRNTIVTAGGRTMQEAVHVTVFSKR